MRHVTVKVGSPGDQQIQPRCEREVPFNAGCVVVWMVGLERIEASIAKPVDPRVHVCLSRMCNRCESARVMQDRNNLLRRRTGARHESRPPGGQPAIERFTRVGNVAGRDHRAGHLWTSDGSSGLLAGLAQQWGQIDRQAQLGEPRADRLDARDSLRALPGQELRQLRVGGIDEIAEHVHVSARVHSGNLDSADGLDAVRQSRSAHLRDGRRRVVICDRHGRHPGGGGAFHELPGRAASVRRGRVKVEVDHPSTTLGMSLSICRRLTARSRDERRLTLDARSSCRCVPVA